MMLFYDDDNHLTKDRLSPLASRTHRGMAHFAGTGPRGKTCRECKYWAACNGYYAKSSRHGDTLKPSPCLQFRKLTGGEGPGIPGSAPACKYFDPAKDPAPLFDPTSKNKALNF